MKGRTQYLAVAGQFSEINKVLKRAAPFARADNMKYWFSVSAACPPNTFVYTRGGVLYESPDASFAFGGRGVEIDAAPAEFGPGGIGGGAPAFTNANYYIGVCLSYDGLGWAGDPYGFSFYYTAEYALAGDAEQAIWPEIMDYQGPYVSDFPVALLVLRNNGVTGTEGQIEPIDVVNRGRSYLFQDVRVRFQISRNIIDP